MRSGSKEILIHTEKRGARRTPRFLFALCAEPLLLRLLCALRQNFVQTLFHILFARTVYA